MILRKLNVVIGAVGFLIAISVAIFWIHANAYDQLSFETQGLLQDLTLVVCPPSLGLLATEHMGRLGVIITVTIIAVQNFVIYFLVAVCAGLVWRKWRVAHPSTLPK